MPRSAIVKVNGINAGILKELNREHYVFEYDKDYVQNDELMPVSLTLPKQTGKFHSEYLFPFFASLIAEGANLSLQLRRLKIDKQDEFGLLLETSSADTIGDVTIHEIKNQKNLNEH